MDANSAGGELTYIHSNPWGGEDCLDILYKRGLGTGCSIREKLFP